MIIAAKMALIPVIIDPLGEDAFATPKVAVSRVLACILVALLAVHLVRHRSWPIRSALWPMLGAYLAIASAATVLAVHPYTAIFGAFKRQLGLLTTLDGLVLMLGVTLFVRTLAHVRWILLGSMAGAAVVLAYGILQLVDRDPIRWVDPTLASTIGNRGPLAGYLVVISATATGAVGMFWVRLKWAERIGLGVIAALSGIEILASGARAAALALPPSVVTAAGLVLARVGPGLRLSRPWVVVVGLAVLVLVLAPISVAFPAVARLAQAPDASAGERELAYRTSMDAVLARPLLGVGPDGLTTVYLALRSPASAELYAQTAPTQSSTHSWLLGIVVGTGVLGLAAMLLIIAFALRRGLTRLSHRDSEGTILGLIIIIAFLAQGVFTVTHVATELFFWLGLGLVTMPAFDDPTTSRSTEPRATRRPSRSAPRHLAWVIAVTVGLLAGTATSGMLNANRAAALSNSARASGDLRVAIQAADAAVQSDPGRAYYWNLLGLAHTSNEPERARSAFARAATAAPYDPVYLLNLAREEAILASGRVPALRDGAIQHARQAVDLDSAGLVTLTRAAEIHSLLGEHAKALSLSARARSLAPRDPARYRAAAQIQEAAGDLTGAVETWLQFLALQYSATRAPSTDRLQVAEFLLRLGDTSRIAQAGLVDPPFIAGADRSCSPTNGSARSSGRLVPRCFRIRLAAEAGFDTGSLRADSLLRVDNYRVDDQPLPAGTTVTASVLSGELLLEVQLPPAAPPPKPGARVSAPGVTDRYGQRVRTSSEAATTALDARGADGKLIEPGVPSPLGVVRGDRECVPAHGNFEEAGRSAPRCFRLWLGPAPEFELDVRSPGSPLRPDSYRIDEQPLPLGTTIQHAVLGDLLVVVQLPAGSAVPLAEVRVSAQGVRTRSGESLDADRSVITLPGR